MAAATADDLDRGGYEVLDRGTCLGLLALGGIGRVGVSVDALPLVLPVHFALADGVVQFRTLIGSTLERATQQAVIAFETDGVDDQQRHWSVAVTGVARHLPSGGSPGYGLLRVAVGPDLISGRRETVASAQDGRGMLHT